MRVQYDIGKVFQDSFAVIKAHPWWVLAWGALLIVLPTIPVIPMFVWMANNFEVLADNPEAMNEMIGLNLLANLSSVLQLLLMVPIIAAVARLVLGKGIGRIVGLRASMDELWVFVTYIAIVLGFFIAAMIIALITVFAGLIVGYASGIEAAGVGTGIVIGLVAILPMIWVGVRLSLLIPASIDLNTFALVPAWKASKGHFWPLLGTAFLSMLIMVAISIVWMIALLLIILVLGFVGGAAGLVAFNEDPSQWNWVALIVIGVVLMAVPTFFMQGLNTVLNIAPFTSAWRQLRPSVEQQGDPGIVLEL
ncbi:hypothetical protein [Brevundimonas sp.]|uniref:hypothetical protein n=1 Tax=Brevundimonas sp. TaxID=1871086 RepID=UPI00289CEA5D|nr:hypothetical protein [Brevundimonas sp.]